MGPEDERIRTGISDGMLWIAEDSIVVWVETEEQYRQLIEDLQQQAYILGWQKGEPES